jgi:cation:H+ antiporter
MIVSLLLVVLGFVLLIKGADWMVEGASSLAKKHNISDLVIGLTIVSFGTSAPELVVNAIASIDNYPDIVFGNVVGSNNFNLFVTLGIVGLIMPITVQSSTVWKEIPLSFLAAVLLFGFANEFFVMDHNVVSRVDGLVLLALFGLFLYYIYKQMKTSPDPLIDMPQESLHIHTMSNAKIWGFIIIGLVGLVVGGRLVVNNAINIATALGVSEKIIGLTIVAMGTSLPELVTSVVAALKKNSDIAIGNVVGSNIFNILLILAISSLINPVKFNTTFNIDIILLMAGTGILFLAMFTIKHKKLDRIEAGILLSVYIVYTGYLIINEV